MLKGYGVGDEKATALAATMTWILKSKLSEVSYTGWKLCHKITEFFF